MQDWLISNRIHYQIVSLYHILSKSFSSDLESISTLNSVPAAERFVVTMDDLMRNPHHRHDVSCDKDSIKSGLATLPESSYAGFERIQHASSTPNKPQACVFLYYFELFNIYHTVDSKLSFYCQKFLTFVVIASWEIYWNISYLIIVLNNCMSLNWIKLRM